MEYGTLAYARRGGTIERFVLSDETVTLGSGPDNHLRLDDPAVAPLHARLICTPGGCWVTDVGSSGGTFLNLVRLQPNTSYPLREGDILRIGPFFIRYTPSRGPNIRQLLAELYEAPTAGSAASGAQISELPSAQVLAPDIAAQLPQRASRPSRGPNGSPLARFRGGPPRIPAGRRMLPDTLSTYLQYMPPCYQDSLFLGKFLLIFESILDPIERTIANLPLYFDPRLVPEPLLPWLASWLGVVLNENWPTERRRELIRAAADLYRRRGTRGGLIDYIRIYAGVDPVIIEPGQPGGAALPPYVFGVILEVHDPSQIDRALVEGIIESQKPAHTAYVLEIRQGGDRNGESAP